MRIKVVYLVCAVQYQYMRDLRRLNECCPMVQNSLPERGGYPIKMGKWVQCLLTHPDEYWCYIVTGLRKGFRVGFGDNRLKACKRATSNMRSAMEEPEVVRDYLSKECAEERVLGPLSPEAFPNVQIS